MFPPSTLHTLRSQAGAERKDRIRLYREVPDETTPDAYDTTDQVLYDGPCSVTESATRIQQASAGDASFDADAMVRMPLVVPFDVQGVQADLWYGGIDASEQVRRAAVAKEVERGRVEMHLFIQWTTHGQPA